MVAMCLLKSMLLNASNHLSNIEVIWRRPFRAGPAEGPACRGNVPNVSTTTKAYNSSMAPVWMLYRWCQVLQAKNLVHDPTPPPPPCTSTAAVPKNQAKQRFNAHPVLRQDRACVWRA